MSEPPPAAPRSDHAVSLLHVPLSEGVGAIIDGVRLLEAARFTDDRGWFIEGWNYETAAEAGVSTRFAQHNLSWSRRGVLRGLHFQRAPHEQAKLLTVPIGEIFDVVVDIRPDSSEFGRWFGCMLSADNRRQLFIPPGCAHGFAVLSDSALVSYMCGAPHRTEAEGVIRWNDPSIGIEWPIKPSILSKKDSSAPLLRDALAGPGERARGEV